MRIAVVGKYTPHINELVDRGHHVHWLTTNDSKRIAHPPNVEEVIWLEDYAEPHIAEAIEARHAKNTFNLMLSFYDKAQIPTAGVARRLAIRHNVDETAARLTLDKLEMRRRLSTHGLYQGFFGLLSRPFLHRALGPERFPLIAKPRKGSGSRSIYLIESRKELFNLESKLGAAADCFLVESFLVGEEFSVECFTHEGKHWVIGVTKKYNDPLTFVELGHVFPADNSAGQLRLIGEYVKACLNKLEVRSGNTHSEVIITSDGPVLVESHTRAGGDCIPELIQRATGRDVIRLACSQALGEDLSQALTDFTEYSSPRRFACIHYLVHRQEGTLVQIRFPKSRPQGFVRAAILKSPGTILKGLHESKDRLAMVITCASSAEVAHSSAEEFVRDSTLIIEPLP